MGVKAWWQSKSVWASITGVVVAIYNTTIPLVQSQFGVTLPPIPVWILGIAGVMGVYGRVTATTTIK